MKWHSITPSGNHYTRKDYSFISIDIRLHVQITFDSASLYTTWNVCSHESAPLGAFLVCHGVHISLTCPKHPAASDDIRQGEIPYLLASSRLSILSCSAGREISALIAALSELIACSTMFKNYAIRWPPSSSSHGCECKGYKLCCAVVNLYPFDG